jgi:hypothetical protein
MATSRTWHESCDFHHFVRRGLTAAPILHGAAPVTRLPRSRRIAGILAQGTIWNGDRQPFAEAGTRRMSPTLCAPNARNHLIRASGVRRVAALPGGLPPPTRPAPLKPGREREPRTAPPHARLP